MFVHAWDFIVIIMHTVLFLIIPHAASMNQFTVSGCVFWGVIGAMGIIMVIVITTATIIVVISLRKISKLSATDQSTEGLEHDNRQSSFNINTERNIAYDTILGVIDSHQ